MSVFRRTLLVAALLCGSAGAAYAQQNTTRLWLAAGIGAAVPTSGGDAITNMAQLVYQKNAHHFALRGVVLHDMQSPGSTTGTDMIGEIGIVYGRVRETGWGRMTLAGGLAGVALDACPDDDDSCFTAGVPLLAEIARSSKYVGIGLQGFGNINAKASYAGAVLFVQLGRVR